MNIFINGQSLTLAKHQIHLADALLRFLTEDQSKTSFAVSVNQEFIGKIDYHTKKLQEDDSIDVFFPIQGG